MDSYLQLLKLAVEDLGAEKLSEMRVMPSMVERRVLKPFLAKSGNKYSSYVSSWRDTEESHSAGTTLKSIIQSSGLFSFDEKDGSISGVTFGSGGGRSRRNSLAKTAASPEKPRNSAAKVTTPSLRKSPARGVKRGRDEDAKVNAGVSDGEKAKDVSDELSRVCQLFRQKLKMDDVISDQSGETTETLLKQLRLMAMALPAAPEETEMHIVDVSGSGDGATAAAETEGTKDSDVVVDGGNGNGKDDNVQIEEVDTDGKPTPDRSVSSTVMPMVESVAQEEVAAPPQAKRRKLTIVRPGDPGYSEALKTCIVDRDEDEIAESQQKEHELQQQQQKKKNKQQQEQQQQQKQKQQPQPQQRQFVSLQKIRRGPPIMADSKVVTVGVLDTNCLLHHAVEVSELRSYSHVLVKIPLAVVRELDFLKTSKDTSVARDARRAINLLLNFVEGFNTNFQMQTTSEIVETRGESRSTNNDERIVKACIFYRAALSNPVFLVTDDVNLRLKAQAFEVPHKSLDEFMAEARKFVKPISYALPTQQPPSRTGPLPRSRSRKGPRQGPPQRPPQGSRQGPSQGPRPPKNKGKPKMMRPKKNKP